MANQFVLVASAEPSLREKLRISLEAVPLSVVATDNIATARRVADSMAFCILGDNLGAGRREVDEFVREAIDCTKCCGVSDVAFEHTPVASRDIGVFSRDSIDAVAALVTVECGLVTPITISSDSHRRATLVP